jgi:hypothetical protein
MVLLTLSQFAIPDSPEDTFWDSYFDTALGPYARPFETLLEEHDFQTVYGIPLGVGKSGSGKGVPKNTEGRKPRYLYKEEGTEGQTLEAPVVSVDCLGILVTSLFVNFHRPFP